MSATEIERSEMQVVLGKFGKSVVFDESKWGAIGGDCEAPRFFACIAKYYPKIDFYMIGKSNMSKMSKQEKKKWFPNNNVIDVWEGFTGSDYVNYVTKMLRGVVIDAGAFFGGPTGCANVPDRIQVIAKRNRGEMAKVLEMFQIYVGPMVHYLNETMLDYFTLSPDPRYHPLRARDLFNTAKFTLSQREYSGGVKRITSYEDQSLVVTQIPSYYSRLEAAFFYGMDRPETHYDKKTKLSFIMNEAITGNVPKGQILEEYVLKNKHLNSDLRESAEICGEWSKEWTDKYKNFKPSVPYSKMWDKTKSMTYTLLFPTGSGWCTAKFWECAYCGVIPFMHPQYDDQHWIKDEEGHRALRVTSPEDFARKIEYLESHPEKRAEIIDNLRRAVKEEYFDGRHVCSIFSRGMCMLGKNTEIQVPSEEDIKRIDSEIARASVSTGFMSILAKKGKV